MRAAIYNPYLDTLGGGERYSMVVALALKEAGYEVFVGWKDGSIKKSLENRFGIDLTNINFVEDVKRGDGYDVCFWVSDGSIPMLKARKNLLHFQVPFRDVNGRSLLNKMKLFRINKVVCNSNFTKNIIDKEFGVESVVVYPPVDVDNLKPKKKENVILFVGRFSTLKQAKGQDVLVGAFKRFQDDGWHNWRLVLAGGVEVGSDEFVEKLTKQIQGYPIKLLKGPSFREIKDLYGKAKIFWSASGFEVDEQKEPERVEHFGISLVEAMAAGAAPIVFKAGGHKEIINDGENGYFFTTEGELVSKTEDIVRNNKKLLYLSKLAQKSVKKYSVERFKKEFKALL